MRSRAWISAFFAVLLHCSGPAPVPEQRLNELIDTGMPEFAENEIRGLLAGFNAKNSTLLSRAPDPRRALRRSLDGTSIAWLEDRYFFYWFEKTFEKLELPESGINFTLSAGGRYAVIIVREEDTVDRCRLLPVALADKHIVRGDYPMDCGHRPAINDSGEVLYYVHRGALHATRLQPPANTRRAPAGIFTTPYKKLSNRLYVDDVGGNRLVVFHGAAGYYEMRLMNWQGDSPRVDLLVKGVSVPRLYGAIETPPFTGIPALPEYKSDPQDQATGAASADARRAARAFVYMGGAGKLQLHPLELGEKPRLGPGADMDYFTRLAYLPRRDRFLALRQEGIGLRAPGTAEEQVLPLSARKFELFSQGLVFEDRNYRLYLRRSEYGPHELRLLGLLRKARAQKF